MILHFVELWAAEWLSYILPPSQLVCQFPFIQTANQTTLLIVIFAVFWLDCPGSYGRKIKVKLCKPRVQSNHS